MGEERDSHYHAAFCGGGGALEGWWVGDGVNTAGGGEVEYVDLKVLVYRLLLSGFRGGMGTGNLWCWGTYSFR